MDTPPDARPADLTAAFREHERAVYGYHRRMGAQPADAADLAQVTFLRALRGVERFRGDSSLRTWLLGIARNVHREWRRANVRLPVPDEDAVGARAGRGPDDLEIDDVLARMEPADRDVLVMRHIAGLDGPEIAQLLGISHAAARQRLSRAAERFRALWGER